MPRVAGFGNANVERVDFAIAALKKLANEKEAGGACSRSGNRTAHGPHLREDLEIPVLLPKAEVPAGVDRPKPPPVTPRSTPFLVNPSRLTTYAPWYPLVLGASKYYPLPPISR